MFNISKQGSSLLITSNDNSQFPWKDGQMSLPMNSVVYVIDESDYIVFKSAANNDILFTALIDEIQINGTNVTKDDFIFTFDNVANSAGGSGGSASAGVNSLNGFQGDLQLKTINGNNIIGSGDITIEGGGSTAGVEAINIGRDIQDWAQKTGVVSVYTSFYNGSYDVNIGGTSFYGLKPIDDSIIIENAGGTVNGNFRAGIKVNPDILGGGSVDTSKFITYVGMMGDTRIAVMTDNDNLINEIYFPTINGQQILGVDGNVSLDWTGTQAEYDALGTYDSGCTYNIIEG